VQGVSHHQAQEQGTNLMSVPARSPDVPEDVHHDTPGITPEERSVIVALAAAWNRFIALPVLHTDDNREFRSAIHAAQNIVAYRVARRVNPDVWK
jgi:hypothetical protein